MAEHPPVGDRDDRTPEKSIQQTLYVPEEQLFQRIPLCRYLSDLSSLFETEDASGEAEGNVEQKEES
jgi:hypothetical protein